MKHYYPEECEGCYALAADVWAVRHYGAKHESYDCGAEHDKRDNVKLTDMVRPSSCKRKVTSYEERRIRQWENFPYLYMQRKSAEIIQDAKMKGKRCHDCKSRNIKYRPVWGKGPEWLCAKCVRRYFKHMKDRRNWHSERVDTPGVKNTGLPRGSGGDKGSGEGGPGIGD